MNLKRLALKFGLGGAALTASAAPLQFTNVSLAHLPNVTFTNKLRAVTYDGASRFVAVGDAEIFVAGSFSSSLPLIAANNWTRTNNPSRAATLTAVTFGNNLFVATGDTNLIDSWDAGPSLITRYSSVFANTALGQGIAFNNNNFDAVAAAPEIGFTNAPPASQNWIPANIPGASFAESYRGITPYGPGFAVCGVFGLVRTSSVAGGPFNFVRGQIGQPDLFSIAAAGLTELVAVGAGNNTGTIQVSTNSGASWITAYMTNGPLNAVAYAGTNVSGSATNFFAVGNGGQLLYSTDGLNWINQNDATLNNGLPGVAAFPTNLNGVASATAGYLRGVSLIVGDGGTVILAAAPPPAPTNPVGATNCEVFTNLFADCALATNNTLSVSNVTNLDFPFGTTTVDWFDAATGGNQLTFCTNSSNGTFTFTPTNNAAMDANHPGFFTFFAQSRDLRTGFISTNRTPVTLRINPRPRANLISTNFPGRFAATNCNISTAYSLTNTLTGIGPWTVTWNDGFVQVNPSNTNGPVDLVRTVIPSDPSANVESNNMYYIMIVSNADTCLANQPGDIIGTNVIRVNPRPTASLGSFSATNCDYGTQAYTLTNTLTGIGPWTVWWSDGVVQTANGTPGTTNTLLRTVIPTNFFRANLASNNMLSVLIVSNDDSCLGNMAGDITGLVTVTINPRPTASLASFMATNCDYGTQSYTLTNTLTGLGPWTVWWSDGVVQTINGPAGTNATLLRTVTPTNFFMADLASNNMLSVLIVSNDDTCLGNRAGDITGLVTVRVNPRPTASLGSFLATNCDYGTQAYTLTNTLTGLGPWTVWWSDGVVQTTNGAVGNNATLLRTVTPTNFFRANLASNNMLSVLVVSNDDTCLGNRAGDITGQVTVKVNPRPTASLGSFLATNCDYGTQSYTLTNTLTGLGPWTVWWSDGVVQTTNGAVGNNATLLRTVTPTNFFRANLASNNMLSVLIVSNDDTCLGNRAGDITGLVTVRVNPRPTASLGSFLATNCDYGTQSYTLTNILTGLGPWTIWWNDGVVQTTNGLAGSSATLLRTVTPTNIFKANVASNNMFSVLIVSNDDTCLGNQAGDITGNVAVMVNPRPTASLRSFTTNACDSGNGFVMTVDLTGVGPWTVLWSDGTPPQTTNSAVLLHTVYPTNSPGANTVSNNMYFVMTVSDNNLCQGNKPGDITGTNSIFIYPRPTATLTYTNMANYLFKTTNCDISQTYFLTNQLTGRGPWSVLWNDGTPQTATNTSSGPVNLVRMVTPTNSSGASVSTTNIYFVTNIVDADSCTNNLVSDILGTNVIIINPRPAVALITTNVTICNGQTQALQFTLSGLGPRFNVYWSDLVVQSNLTAGLNLRPVSPTNLSQGTAGAFITNYFFSVTNVLDVTNHCTSDPINHPEDILGGPDQVAVKPRPAITLVATNTMICNGSNQTFLYILSGVGPFSVYWSDQTVQTNLPAGLNSLTVSPTNLSQGTAGEAPTNYAFWVTTVSDSLCSTLPGDILGGTNHVKVNPRPTAALVAISSTNVCSLGGVTNRVDLAGVAPWTVIWSDGFLQTTNNTPLIRVVNPINTNTSIPITTNYSVLSVSNDLTGCVALAGDISGLVQITVLPRATATVTNGYVPVCFTGTVTNYAQLAGIGPWTVVWSSNSVNIQTNMVMPPTNYDTLVVTVSNMTDTTILTNVFAVSSLTDAMLTNCTPSSVSNATIVVYPALSAMFITSDTPILTNSSTVLTLMLTGTQPWHLAWSDGTNETATTSVWNRTVYGTNIANFGSSFAFYLTNLTDSSPNCPAQTPLSDTNTVSLVAQPLTNLFVVFGGATICPGQCTTNVFITLSNAPFGMKTYSSPWVVHWSDGTFTTNICDGCPGMIGYKMVCPATTTNITAVSVKAKATTDGSHNTWPSNFIGGSATITISPVPSGVVLTNISQVSCAGVTNPPLFVVFTNGDGGNWYDQSGHQLATNTTSYVSTNTMASALFFTVKEVNANGCTNNLPGTVVSLTHTNCTLPLSIRPLGDTNVLLHWFGNLELQSASNLNPPVAWSLVTNPLAMGTNYFTVGTNDWINAIQFSITNQFFRLSYPTN